MSEHRLLDSADLIARLENATGPDRELDLDIGRHVCPVPIDPDGWVTFPSQDNSQMTFSSWCRAYTFSIDAALTLVPPWSWRVGNLPSGTAFADLGTQASLQCVEGATPAIALCIAALKARSTVIQ